MTTVKVSPTSGDPYLCDRLSRLLMVQAGELTARWAERLSDRLRAALSPYPMPEDPQLVQGIANCLAGLEPRLVEFR